MDLISQMWEGVYLKHVQRFEDILSYLSFIGIITKKRQVKKIFVVLATKTVSVLVQPLIFAICLY